MSRKAFNSPQELSEKVDAYFLKCEESKDIRELKSGDIRIRQELPSVVGLAVYLGVSQPTLSLYSAGKYDNNSETDTETYSSVLARARDRIELESLKAASNGDTDSRIALARLAKFGYSTKVETESKATLTVQWEGASLDDINMWGK